MSRGSIADAPKVIQSYLPGAVVTIIYNPVDPAESPLVKDYPAISIFFTLLGTRWVAFAVFASF